MNMDVASFTTISVGSIFFYAFTLAFTIQLWYYLYYFNRLSFHKKNKSSSPLPPVSVIICSRNEEKNLVNFLPLILDQEYPNFEVVVVNHFSYDNTADILDEFCEKHAHLKVVTMQESPNHYHGKKVALMMGIKGAANEHLLLTDADCRPKDKFWVKDMMQQFNPDAQVVLGYGGYEKGKGILNRVIRFDTFMIGLQYLSFALAGKSYMGIGRNLAYTKSLFYKAKGFASHYHVESGDDDLFINEVANNLNAKINVSLESETLSVPKKTFRELFRQKRRHHTTFDHYSTGSKIRLATFTISQYLFFSLFMLLLLLQFKPIIVLSILGLRVLIQFITFGASMKLLSEKDLLLFAPLLEIALLIMYPLITISNLFIKKNKWAN